MPMITINGAPTIIQRDGTSGKLEVVNDGRTLRLTCRVAGDDERLMHLRPDEPVTVEVHGDLHTAVLTRDGLRSIGDQPNVLHTLFMRPVRMERDVTSFNEWWLVLECDPIRDRSGAPTLEEEMGL